MSFPVAEHAEPRNADDESAPRWPWLGSPELLKRAERFRRPAVAAALVLLVIAGVVLWRSSVRETPVEVTYSELLRAIDARRVNSLTVRPGKDIRGEWIAASADAANGPTQFVAAFPVYDIDTLTERAERAGVDLELRAAPSSRRIKDAVASGLQLLIFAALGYFLYLQYRSQHGEGFGRSGQSKTRFRDVAGTQGAAEELRELVSFLQDPRAFAAVGARVPKGALLVGPPGTGKTLLARAVAGEAGVPFFSLSGSEVTGFLVGLGAQRIKSLFKKARKNGGVIFIDEIDALGGKRGRNQSHNEDDRTLNQLLVEMDGFAPTEGVVVLAATNRPDGLDPALRRPGRFDRTVSVGLPTAAGREEILRLHVVRQQIPLGDDVDLARLARLSPGSSGADLANLLNEAAIAAAREGEVVVRWAHFEAARDRILLGKERIGFTAAEEEWKTVAYHEAGHALAGVIACPEDGLHKVTIQPRGEAMGVAFFAPEDNRHLYRRTYLEGQIIKGLAGRAAEELVFGADAITSGAQHDLVQVNGIARKMIYQLGMGATTGLLIHDGQPGSLSAAAHGDMDREVRQLLEHLYAYTRELLQRNLPALHALAQALLERETLDGDEAIRLLEAHGLSRPEGPLLRPATALVSS